jgi:hypothetical protein
MLVDDEHIYFERNMGAVTTPTNQRLSSTAYKRKSPYVSMDFRWHSYHERAEQIGTCLSIVVTLFSQVKWELPYLCHCKQISRHVIIHVSK